MLCRQRFGLSVANVRAITLCFRGVGVPNSRDVLDTLLFVDTNVLLDFYRIRKTDISLKYLEQLEACKDRLIIGSQVEMEYKKNRQRVIVESLMNFGTPDWGKLTGPALVADLQAMKMIEKKKKERNIAAEG